MELHTTKIDRLCPAEREIHPWGGNVLSFELDLEGQVQAHWATQVPQGDKSFNHPGKIETLNLYASNNIGSNL